MRHRTSLVPQDQGNVGGGSNVFYIIIFAGLAVLLVVAVLVQRARNK